MEIGAFRHDDAEEVAKLVAAFATERGLSAWIGTEPGDKDPDRLDVYESLDGWTVVFWPSTAAEAAAEVAQAISRQLGTVASCVSFYDGDFWSHLAYDSGRERDRFTSRPDYFEEDAGQSSARWRTDPATVAEVFGVPTEDIVDYLTPLTADEADDGDRRANPDDEFALSDAWVFVDFWRRLGITYPDADVPPWQCGVTFSDGWEKALVADGAR